MFEKSTVVSRSELTHASRLGRANPPHARWLPLKRGEQPSQSPPF